jgi:hypothetical protein
LPSECGTTRLPLLPWSGLTQTWGHPWHPMCSYLGAFPAGLARSLITMLSDEGDVVLDPFAGRGTTLLESRVTRRVPLTSDLNPIAVALARAKNVSVTLEQVLSRIASLERIYDAQLYLPEAQVEPDEIQLIFHMRTLAQLCFLRWHLAPEDDVDSFLIGAALGILHGAERQDGGSSYASISMPNTFSMSPDYVRRYVETKRLQRIERNVFELLKRKVERLFQGFLSLGPSGIVAQADAKQVSEIEEFQPFRRRVKLVVTSPPYLDVVNYAKQNWIRCWFLKNKDTGSDILDDNLTLNSWVSFMNKALAQIVEMITPDGVIVFVIGDVVRSSRSVVSLARELTRRLIFDGTFSYIGCLSDHLDIGLKTTRIWGDTKGQATSVDRIIILSNSRPSLRSERLGVELFGDPKVTVPNLDADLLEATATAFAG